MHVSDLRFPRRTRQTNPRAREHEAPLDRSHNRVSGVAHPAVANCGEAERQRAAGPAVSRRMTTVTSAVQNDAALLKRQQCYSTTVENSR